MCVLSYTGTCTCNSIRDHPFNLKGGGGGLSAKMEKISVTDMDRKKYSEST